VRRLGRARLTRFLHRHSRGAWREGRADQILAAAAASIDLWGQDLPAADLAEDIALEARLALRIGEEIADLDERIKVMLAERDPSPDRSRVVGVIGA